MPFEPTVREIVDETVPLVEVVPGYGPPVVLVAGPVVLLSLLLAGPFAALVTIVVALAAVAAVIGLIGAVLASPFLLVRYVRGHRPHRASMPAVHTAQLVPGGAR